MSTDVEESMEFFEFMSSSEVGGNGSRYGFGNNPTAMEEQQTIEQNETMDTQNGTTDTQNETTQSISL